MDKIQYGGLRSGVNDSNVIYFRVFVRLPKEAVGPPITFPSHLKKT